MQLPRAAESRYNKECLLLLLLLRLTNIRTRCTAPAARSPAQSDEPDTAPEKSAASARNKGAEGANRYNIQERAGASEEMDRRVARGLLQK